MPPRPVVGRNREEYSEGPTRIYVCELQRLVWCQLKKRQLRCSVHKNKCKGHEMVNKEIHTTCLC